MQFLYHEASGQSSIILEDEPFRYLIKARREKEGAVITTRNLKDPFLYRYELSQIAKRNATLTLLDKEEKIVPAGNLHIGWCVIDPKTVEKALPMLNQMGVKKITFIQCAFSQKNFKASPDRLEKILVNSCEQCGRSDLMEIDFSDNVKDFLQNNPSCAILDFNPSSTFDEAKPDTLLIGCEGGFSDAERKLFAEKPVIAFPTGMILKSETAAVAAAAKLLL